MTPSEFAKTIREKHPGAYDDMDDESLTTAVLKKYPQYVDMVPSRLETTEEGHGEYPSDTYTSLAPNANIVMNAVGAPGAVKGAVGIAKGLKAGVEALPEVAGDVVSKVKGMLPNPSLKGLGYTPSQLSTEAGQNLAKGVQEYATTPQGDIGELVAKAANPVKKDAIAPFEPENAEDLATLDPALQSKAFNEPIAQGMANSTEQMRDLANEQWKQVGNAIGDTLNGLEKTGSEFDPQPVLQKINSMFLRDAEGNVMNEGVQGTTNEALKEAVDTLNGYSKGRPISWTDANKIKSMLQDSANYAAKRFEESNEAYKQAASLIKEGIDDQAGTVLQKHGGDIQNFQKLRGAYGKLSSLRSSLNAQTGKEMLQPSLGESVMSAGKKLLPYGVAGAVGAKVIHHVMGGF